MVPHFSVIELKAEFLNKLSLQSINLLINHFPDYNFHLQTSKLFTVFVWSSRLLLFDSTILLTPKLLICQIVNYYSDILKVGTK